MIYLRLYGGLGNQMFQYAFGYALSKKYDKRLVIETNYFSENTKLCTPRSFELDVYKITSQITKLPFFAHSKILVKIFQKFPVFNIFSKVKYFPEKSFTYNDILIKPSLDYFFDGYWQSFKYFEEYREELLQVFSNISVDPINAALMSRISNNNSISVHIRRGDYVTNNIASSHHGTCSLDYYRDAINYFQSLHKDACFFVFSDEPQWAKDNIVFPPTTTFINHNTGKNSYLDMHLMSKCRHNIIANSSFSWWAAWLNSNDHKIVIAPMKWFNTEVDTTDLIPPTWIRL